MDWENQPDPFRTYEGAPIVELPLAGDDLDAPWDELHTPGAVSSRPLDRSSLGALLELALGLTAWKEVPGSRWALRANPSSGNLHPTEGYALICNFCGGDPKCVKACHEGRWDCLFMVKREESYAYRLYAKRPEEVTKELAIMIYGEKGKEVI